MPYYPIFLDIQKKRCIVIGGGSVALRKINMLIDHDANVEVISPEICLEIEELMKRGTITLTKREYQSGDLEGAFVVVAATDNQVTNKQVAEEASEKGILINVVDVPSLSNFIVPSYLRRGDLTIAVSTNGKSPALSRKMRKKLEEIISEDYAELTSLIEEVRSELKGSDISGQTWQNALNLESLIELIRTGRCDEAKTQLLRFLREAN